MRIVKAVCAFLAVLPTWQAESRLPVSTKPTQSIGAFIKPIAVTATDSQTGAGRTPDKTIDESGWDEEKPGSGLYNSLLNERRHDYEVLGKAPSCFAQQKHLPVWKKEHPELSGVYSQVLQNVAKRADLAFDAFFRRVQKAETPGYPRFKGRGQYDSITYPQSGFSLGENTVILSRIGTVKAVLHRPTEGTVKTCMVKRKGEKWYVTLSCQVEAEPLPDSEEKIGIDAGLNKFATLSNGETIENPRFYRRDEKALAKAQRKLDKVKNKHRSKARRKATMVVRRVHERIRNRRHDFVHQTARRLVSRESCHWPFCRIPSLLETV